MGKQMNMGSRGEGERIRQMKRRYERQEMNVEIKYERNI